MKKVFIALSFFMLLHLGVQAQSPATYEYAWEKSSQNTTVLRSQNGKFKLIYQADGNLVIYKGSRAIWASQTNGKPSTHLSFQADGNLVIYNYDQTVWSSKSNTKQGKFITMQDDGNLVVYRLDNAPIWASGTNGR